MKYCWLKRVPLGQRKLYLRGKFEFTTEIKKIGNVSLEFEILVQPPLPVLRANVERLTFRFGIRIVT